VLSFFPKESPADTDERKRAITVENLLRMESDSTADSCPVSRNWRG
jgi:hypothetical protein